MSERDRAELLSDTSEGPWMCTSRSSYRFLQIYRGWSIPYLCTIAALRVVVVLGGQLAVCVFIRGYTVIVMLVVINAQVQCVWQRKMCLFITHSFSDTVHCCSTSIHPIWTLCFSACLFKAHDVLILWVFIKNLSLISNKKSTWKYHFLHIGTFKTPHFCRDRCWKRSINWPVPIYICNKFFAIP